MEHLIDYADDMAKSLKEVLALLPIEEAEEYLDSCTQQEIVEMDREEWWYTSRPEQVPPVGDWTIHLYLGGRGTGKTKSGAEWLVQRCLDFPFDTSGFPVDRMVMAYNLSDTRTTCIEGSSGILRILHRRGIPYEYIRSPKPRLILTDTGTRIHFTGADPDAPRGFNLADIWMDEIVKWDEPDMVWKYGIHPALRAALPGDKPRAFVTTTPKPIKPLQAWSKRVDGFVSMSRGSTFDNAANLSEDFLSEIKSAYDGTAVGRQELYGELIDDIEGPLFSYRDIDNNRIGEIETTIVKKVLGVDPCLTGDEEGDYMGVVVAARGVDKKVYILADESQKLTGRQAADHVWTVFAKHECDVLLVETNLGKQWLTQVLEDSYKHLMKAGMFPEHTTPPIKEIHSNHGKKLRAEPVALRYQQGKVRHVGRFKKLEDQMVSWDPLSSKASPDRLDALVHAVRFLIEGEANTFRIFSPTSRPVRGL